MPTIYYARVEGARVADAFGLPDEARIGLPEVWHFASIDGETYHSVSHQPGPGDYEVLDEYINKGGTLPMGFGHRWVAHVSAGIDQIEV